MADEPPPAGPAPQPPPSPEPAPVAYASIRWSIRLTGVVLMFSGMIYVLLLVYALLFGKSGGAEGLFPYIVSLVTIGLGVFVLRTGIQMFRSVDAAAIGHFSFVFSLVYTFILLHILPLEGIFLLHPRMLFFLVICFVVLSYGMLRHILVRLLLDLGEKPE